MYLFVHTKNILRLRIKKNIPYPTQRVFHYDKSHKFNIVVIVKKISPEKCLAIIKISEENART